MCPDPATELPVRGQGGSWASPAPLGACKQPAQGRPVCPFSNFIHKRGVCLVVGGGEPEGRAWRSAGWGGLPRLTWSHPLREGAADHRDASAPGNPTPPKKGLFIPKNLMGEVITGRAPARENRLGLGGVRAAPAQGRLPGGRGAREGGGGRRRSRLRGGLNKRRCATCEVGEHLMSYGWGGGSSAEQYLRT